MSNSNLVNYVKLSPHCNKPRLHKIDKITIHHMAAVNASIERCGEEFAKPNRRGSSNYGIKALNFTGDATGNLTMDGMVYTSKVNGNVYTPQLVPTNWILKE